MDVRDWRLTEFIAVLLWLSGFGLGMHLTNRCEAVSGLRAIGLLDTQPSRYCATHTRC